jgi:hypothetical protein
VTVERCSLQRLAIYNGNLPAASIDFDPDATIIYGASDTGKSYIASALDFLLGAREIKDIPEASGYTHAALEMVFGEARAVTLVRPLGGGPIALYEGIEGGGRPSRPADAVLAPAQTANNASNLSRFMLDALAMDGRVLTSTAKQKTRALSFRDVARLCIVDETEMQSQTPPALTGQYVTGTVEKSTLELLLNGGESREVALLPDAPIMERQVSRAKAELLEQLIQETSNELLDQPDLESLERQLAALNQALAQDSYDIEGALTRRDDFVALRQSLSARLNASEVRLGELAELHGRFSLLHEQYSSDLQRLEAVSEAGTLLGYFDRGVCVFCGAALEHQDEPETHVAEERTDLAVAVAAETSKTRALRSDLEVTLNDIREEEALLRERMRSDAKQQALLDEEVARLDNQLQPLGSNLREVVGTKVAVERAIALHAQRERYEALLADVALASPSGTRSKAAPATGVLADLARTIQSLLDDWGVPDLEPTFIDPRSYDLVVGGQPRSARGKGVRSILHAAFNLGLATHCLERELPHPGFVVLDSPLIS